jgi:hypothetical protein
MEKARSHTSPQFWELLEYDLGVTICYHFFLDDKRLFTFCSSMANWDDYLKFDEGEKIFHQFPYLWFYIVFSIF